MPLGIPLLRGGGEGVGREGSGREQRKGKSEKGRWERKQEGMVSRATYIQLVDVGDRYKLPQLMLT